MILSGVPSIVVINTNEDSSTEVHNNGSVRSQHEQVAVDWSREDQEENNLP